MTVRIEVDSETRDTDMRGRQHIPLVTGNRELGNNEQCHAQHLESRGFCLKLSSRQLRNEIDRKASCSTTEAANPHNDRAHLVVR